MKKFKKIFAVLLTLAMVLGMSMTTFAADIETDPNGAAITVKELAKEETVVTLYQIATWNATTNQIDVPSWAEAFLEENKTTNSYEIKGEGDEIAKNWLALKEAAKTNGAPSLTETVTDGTYTSPKVAIGWYIIDATGVTTQQGVLATSNYTYNEGVFTATTPADLVAKPEGYKTVKKLSDVSGDAVIARGDSVEYDIDQSIPLDVVKGDQNRTYKIVDTTTGLSITGVVVSLNEAELTENTDYTLVKTTGENQVKDNIATITLNSTALANVKAGDVVHVHVTATATGNPTDGYTNKAQGDGSSESDTVRSRTGQITIQKKDDENNNLAGAEFSVAVKGTTDKIAFVGENGVYMKATEAEIAANENLVYNLADDGTGKVEIKGLDEGEYVIKEEKAPNGYSINETPDQPAAINGANSEENIIVVSTTVTDTKLTSLPGTGGIGTTIFTIGGCAIMIIAAALFFASRRKSAK